MCSAGGHITDWWIYVDLSPTTTKSRVVFGETTCKARYQDKGKLQHAYEISALKPFVLSSGKAVNSTPHMWARGKTRWLPKACPCNACQQLGHCSCFLCTSGSELRVRMFSLPKGKEIAVWGIFYLKGTGHIW